jgi:hypothetical protein
MDALDLLAGPAGELLTRVDGALARSGAPDAHPIWPLLRRVGALPGAAVGAVAELRPAPLAAAAPSLRTLAQGYAEASAAAEVTRASAAGEVTRVGEAGTSGLSDAIGVGDGTGVGTDVGGSTGVGTGVGGSTGVGTGAWEGAAAEAFANQWATLSAHLAAAGESLSARLEETAAYADSVAAWMARTREAVAETLARVLTSAEAVVVVTGPAAAGWISPESPAPAGMIRACADIGVAVLAPVARAYEQASELAESWTPRLAELPYRPHLL